MAEKRSWRDYAGQSTATKTEKEEKTGSWRDYASDNKAENGSSSVNWRDPNSIANIVGGNITKRVNNYIKSHNSYISDYQKRYEGRKGDISDSYVSDSADWLDQSSQRKSSLNKEADDILSYIDQNKDYLDEKWVDEIRKTISSTKGTQGQILNASRKDNEYWNSFGADEELVGKYGSAEGVYNYLQRTDSYSKKHEGKTSEELFKLASSMEDGEEKDWLTSYASSVEYDELGKLDLNEATKELEEFGDFYDSAVTIGLWYQEYMGGRVPYDEKKLEYWNRYVNEYNYDLKAIENDYNQKEARINRAKDVQKLNAMSSVSSNEDFAEKSQYVSNVDYGLLGKPSFTDNTYAYVNNPTVEDKRALGAGEISARELINFDHDIYDWDGPTRNRGSSFEKDALDYIKPEEVAIYNYYYATEGPERAKEYLDLLVGTFQERKDADTVKKVSEFTRQSALSAVFASALSVGTSLGSGFEYLGDIIEYGGQKLFGKDAELGTNENALATNAVRGTVADQIDWKIGNWDAGAFLYNTAMSGVDSVASSVFGGAGGAVLGLSAAAQGTNDALNRGMSNEQAFWNGLFSGTFECLFESISLGQFNKLKEVPIKVGLKNMDKAVIKTFAKNLGKSMLVNATEEMATELANIAYDTLANGELANYTLEELKNGAWKNALQQIGEAGASGALMGMGMSAVGSTIGHRKGVKAANEDAVKNYGNKTDALIQEGLENDAKSDSYKLAQKYQAKTNKGKTLSGQQIRNLLAANQEQITAKDLKLIQKAAETRLTELGQTEDVAKVAELATKRATGQNLTRAEKSFLANSKYGARVANELLPENIESGDYSTEWAEGIGTKRVNSLHYNITNIIAEMTKPATYKALEQRVAEEDKFSVSESGTATDSKTGEAIDLSKPEIVDFVRDKETGKVTDMILKVDGKEIKASEIDYADADQSYLYTAVKSIENITPGDAQTIVRDYDPASGLSVGEYLNGIDEAYTYGYHGYTEADMGAGLFTPKLSSELAKSAYLLGQKASENRDTEKSDAIKRMRTAVEAEAEKAMADGKPAPKAKKMTIKYNAGNGDVVDIKYNRNGDVVDAGVELTDNNRSAVVVAKFLHKLGIGTNFEFFSSKVKNGKRVYIDDNGAEQPAPAGVYQTADGTIRIDLNAYNGRQFALNALAHELTHFIQQWSDTKYKVLAEFLVKTYEKTDMTMHQRVIREQNRINEIRKAEAEANNTEFEPISYNKAFDEVVANAMGKMFDDGKLLERLTELKAQDANLVKKLWEGIKKILSKILGVYQADPGLFRDTQDLMKLKEDFEQLQNIFAEALVEASDNFQTSLTAAESQTLTEAGIGFDESTKSVYSLNFSHAHQEQIQVGKKTFDAEAVAQMVSKVTGRSIDDARKWVQSEMTIANIVMQNPEFLDFEADNRYEAIKKNSDYPQGTVDLSNLCPKREEFTTMFDMLQKKYPNKLFTAQDVAEMRKILAENNITVACGACFVEDRRQLLGEIADTYINMWKEAVESGNPLQKTNAAGVKSDLLVTKALAKQYGLTAGTQIMATDTYIPNQYDLTTYEGFKKLEKNHPTIAMGFNRYNNSRGQQSARLIEGRAEYNRQILGWSDAKVKSVNNNGGLRIFSFSDFEVVHLLDLAQVIIDCAAKGVKIQGYTKIPAFAKLVRNTGVKLNRSLIPKGDYGYHMENGKVVLDYDTTEGIDINDKNFIDESNNPNVGNIVIGINPTQIGAAMLDPFIDYIIPFHSNKAKEILRKLGTGEWVNYKESQHEKDIATGSASKRNVNIYTEVINKYNPTNKVEFVEAFLKECKRQGKIPRYAEFLNVDANGDYAYREGYHKLLVDFKMFDAEGNILPQGNITPNLDENFMKELLNAEIDKKQNYEFPQEVYDAIDKKFGEKYSSQETDIDNFEIADYPKIKLSAAEQRRLEREAMTWNADKAGSVLQQTLSNGYTYVYCFDNEYNITVLNKFKVTNIHERQGAIDDKRNRTKTGRNNGGSWSKGRTDTSDVFGTDRRTASKSDISSRKAQPETQTSDRRGHAEDTSDSDKSEVKELYSSQETDADYMAALDKGDIVAAQKLVDQAANAAGYTQKAYHGTGADFNIFSDEKIGGRNVWGKGFYFGTGKGIANDYASWRESKGGKYRIVSASLKMENPYINRKSSLGTAEEILDKWFPDMWKESRELGIGYINGKLQSSPLDLLQYIAEHNKIEVRDVLKSYGYDSVKDGGELVVFSPEQIKSNEPVVWDDNGKVIPLSERFNEDSNDIRYSTQETDNISNRDLLANAFEMVVKDSTEYKKLQEYKGHIKLLNEYEEKLSNLNAEIRKMLFDNGVERDAKKLKELQTEAKKVRDNINRHDRELLSLEASEPLRKVIEQERKKAAQKTKDHVKELLQNKKARAEQTEYRHKIRKTIRDLDKILNRGNKKQNVKEDMKGFVSKALELADYLFTDHISNDELIRKGITVRMTAQEESLVRETEDILTKIYDEADSLTDEEFTRLDAKRKANEEKLRDLLKAQRNEKLNTPVYQLFDDLATEYASLKNSSQDAVKAAYSEEVERLLRTFTGEADSDRAAVLKNMRVADMTTEELWKLYNAYTMVLTTVRDANKFHVKGMNASIEQVVGQIAGDFGSRKIPDKKLAIALQKIGNKIGWNYEKLYYALDRIGSVSFTKLIENLANSENTVMRDVQEAIAFRDQAVEKYGFNNWAVNKEIDREFLDNTGKKFKLTLGQLMALYAYSRREGAWDHIEYGGFVFGEAALTNPRPADSYKLSKEQCEAITSLLTNEQKGYVQDMQKFLSETMGAKGNEVSMLLYGIKMFGEENYFPIHIAGQFKAQANESQAKAAAGFSSMSNAGFTHAQNPNAKAPFVLEGFNEVWSDHVNEMSRYHGTVPALEDIRRVMNRSTYSDSVSESQSIKQLMENSFGKEAVDYFDSLYREANSGAIQDKLQRIPKKLLSLFRKNSVAYSLSVIIQQPSAMARAYAMIDKKYFGFHGVGALTSGVVKAVSSKWNPAYANTYNKMLKYAPGVTMAKEIGGFDTHTGTSIREYLLDTNKSLKQKWKTENALGKAKAALDVVDNNAIANLPNVADKIAWIEIWNACEREAVATRKDLVPNSEEFLQAVGDRFTEVIRATQVYDSIFAKSPMLKSKNLAVQYLVSFMNEPNTTANMVEKAVRDAVKGNWKSGVRTAAAVTYSIIFNNVLKAIVYAMRDDDEDEAYIEKYLAAVAGGMMDDFNPINYIPIARDAWSKFQGYDVERPDVAIISDAIEAIQAKAKYNGKDTENMTEEQIAELDKKITDANWKLVGSLAAFFGIPVKNVYREIEGVIDHARIASANAGMATPSSVWDKVKGEILDSIPFAQPQNTKQDKLYEAIVNGDKAYLDRLKSGYKDDSAYQSAVRKALRENDSRIHDAAQARYEGNAEEYKRIFREIQKEGKFSFDDIMSAINSEENAIKNKLEPDKATSSYTASDFVESIVLGDSKSAQAMKEDIIATKVANGKTQEEAEKEFASNVSSGIRDAYSSGLLDEAGAEKMLMEYADKDEEEAASKVSYWAFCEEHPEYADLSESNVSKYKEFAEPENISLDVYAQFINGTKGLTEIKDKWGDVEVTKREQVLEVIDSLPLTWQQKDALYLAAGYSENKIWDVPW